MLTKFDLKTREKRRAHFCVAMQQENKNLKNKLMAIYHCSIQSVARSEGRSAVAASAYRSGDKLLDERLGETSDYSRKKGIEHSEILLPKGVKAEWALDRQMLWNAAELSENRKNARVAREVEVSLPHELNAEARITLTKDFAQYLADYYKVAVDFAIHQPHDRSDERNTHAHILMTTREITEQGFTDKSIFEKDMRWLLANNLPTARMQYQAVREQWANFANKALEAQGLNIRIDHRSFADQGINLAPTQHVGVSASRMQQKGVETERQRLHPEDAKLNAQLIQENPAEIFKVITAQKSVFTQHDLAKAVHRYTDSLADYQACLQCVMASSELVLLKQGQSKEFSQYSTKAHIALEQDMLGRAQSLSDQNTHVVSDTEREKAIAEQDELIRKITGDKGLSEAQKLAIRALAGPERLTVVEGLAGAGKSTLLAAAKVAWQGAGYQVLGGALSGKAAEGLEESSGITSRTLASWEYSITKGRDRMNDKTVFVIDEAGMVASRQLARFIKRVDETGGKLVLVGDSEQLQPINAGAPFRAIAERVKTTGLMEIRRQYVDWQRQASVDFAQQRTGEGLAAYANHHRVHFHPGEQATRTALVKAYVQDRLSTSGYQHLVLAHTRRDVYQLNQEIRSALKQKDRLRRGIELKYATQNGERAFTKGDRFVFLENDRALGVKNGMLGRVESVQPHEIQVRVDGKSERVTVPVKEYTAFDHGYATTIHKSQGATVEKTYVLATPNMDRHLTYVAMTRHKCDAQMYVNQQDLPDLSALSRSLSRGGGKATTLDYQVTANIELPPREGLVPPGHYENALNHYAQAYHSVLQQQARNLPVLESQKSHLAQAEGLLEQARPGVAAIVRQVLSSDAQAQKIVAEQAGRARAEGLVQRLYQWQTGKPDQSQPMAARSSVKPRDQSPYKPKPIKTLSESDRAIYHFAKAVYEIDQQERAGLPVLNVQKQMLAQAKQHLSKVKPEITNLVEFAVQQDRKTRKLLAETFNHSRVKQLVAAVEGSSQQYEAHLHQQKQQQAQQAQRERSRGYDMSR